MKLFTLLIILFYATYGYSQNDLYLNHPDYPEVELEKYELVKKGFFTFDEPMTNDLDFDHCQISKFAFLFKRPEAWKIIKAGFFSTSKNLPIRFEQAGKYAILMEQDGIQEEFWAAFDVFMSRESNTTL